MKLLTWIVPIMLFSSPAIGQGLLVARSFHKSPLRDSTAYFYDHSGILRSTVSFRRVTDTSIWKPMTLTVIKEIRPGYLDQVNYWYDSLQGWLPQTWGISDTSQDKRSIVNQTFIRQPGKPWTLFSKNTTTKTYEGIKLVEVNLISCDNCSGDTRFEADRKDIYKYDSNDSLILYEYMGNKYSGRYGSRTEYDYQLVDFGWRKTTRVYSWINLAFSEVSRVEALYSNRRLVTSKSYTLSNGQVIFTKVDSFAYNLAGSLVYSVSRSFAKDGSPGSSTRYFYTLNSHGQAIEKITESWNKATETWYPSMKAEYTYSNSGIQTSVTQSNWVNGNWRGFSKVVREYNSSGSLLSESVFASDTTTTWKLSSGAFYAYDQYNRLVEKKAVVSSGPISTELYYYKETERYKPLEPSIRVLVHPNPARQSITANVYATDYYDINFNVFDVLGRSVIAKNFHVIPGVNSLELVPNLPLRPGYYIYSADAGPVLGTVTGKFLMIE